MKIIVATTNRHKYEEIKAILGASAKVFDLSELPSAPIIEETGSSFKENAQIKAEGISHLTDAWVLADDSGLEVDAIGGQPGIYSARFAGAHASDKDNRKHLLHCLQEVPQPWEARFRCLIAIAKNGQTKATFEGSCKGHILTHERGTNGFGYDALFVPEGYKESFAALPRKTKNVLSHRGRALEAFKQWWLLKQSPLLNA